MKTPLQLQFTDALTYSGREAGITLPVKLISGGIECEIDAKFDPGAHVCLFSREIGEFLGLDVERGLPIKVAFCDRFNHFHFQRIKESL